MDLRAARQLEQRLAEALPEEAAVGLREQRLGDLEPGVVGVLPRIEPDVDALLHVAHGAAKNHAPARNSASPATTNDARPVATYSSARKAPKNISELPRSRMKTSITIAAPQTTSSGPKCFSGGIVTPSTRRAPTTSMSPCSVR